MKGITMIRHSVSSFFLVAILIIPHQSSFGENLTNFNRETLQGVTWVRVNLDFTQTHKEREIFEEAEFDISEFRGIVQDLLANANVSVEPESGPYNPAVLDIKVVASDEKGCYCFNVILALYQNAYLKGSGSDEYRGPFFMRTWYRELMMSGHENPVSSGLFEKNVLKAVDEFVIDYLRQN